MTLLRRTLRLAAVLLAVWLCAIAGAVLFGREFVYQFRSEDTATPPARLPGARIATLAADDGTPLSVWLIAPREGRPVVLFFAGGSGALAWHAGRMAVLAGRGFGVAALNYRGANGVPGKPTQAAITADAVALHDGLDALLGHPVAAERRVIYGVSLGAAVAVQLAARRPAAGLVLEAPFNRLCDYAEHRFPFLPVCLVIPAEQWDSAARIHEVRMPLLVLHGDTDRIVPLALGQRLFAAAREPKRLIVYPGGGHDDLHQRGAGADVAAFVDAVAGK